MTKCVGIFKNVCDVIYEHPLDRLNWNYNLNDVTFLKEGSQLCDDIAWVYEYDKEEVSNNVCDVIYGQL